MKKFCLSTIVAYVVVDYWLSCKELTALQSCWKKSLQNGDMTTGGLYQESIHIKISPTKANTKQPSHQEDPFSDGGISKEPKKFIPVTSQSPGPPSENSSFNSDSEPAKPPIPPWSTKPPTAVTSVPNSKPKHYQFNLKFKPESVPQWDRNLDILARWISKVNCLVSNLPEIKEELRKIVLRRLTNFAKTWYYSIPDAERVRIEENWTTLTKAISEYWTNHHWLEKQKLRANKARFREAGHQPESPSEYVICKMELLILTWTLRWSKPL